MQFFSVITCPVCGFQKQEIIPENACRFFYECTRCKLELKPVEGNCCVFCSYGNVKCPPEQFGAKCC